MHQATSPQESIEVHHLFLEKILKSIWQGM